MRAPTAAETATARGLKFLHKLALMPALAALGFLLVLLVLVTLGSRNGKLLQDIESGYFLAYEASGQLADTLTEIQRGLQDAATTMDRDLLEETDKQRDKFFAILTQTSGNPTIDPARVQRIRDRFRSYYGRARETAQRTIAGESIEALNSSRIEAVKQTNAIRQELDSLTAHSTSQMQAAFQASRNNQSSSVVAIATLTVAFVLALSALSFFVIRSLRRPLQEAVMAATSLAR